MQHYRPVFTRKPSDFDFDRMNAALDDGRRLNDEEEARVFKSLPLRVHHSHPVITIEPVKHSGSIALITRERRHRSFISYTEVRSVELRISGIADFADELEWFENGTLGGEAHEETSTVLELYRRVRMRCLRGEYEIATWPFGSDGLEQDRDSITMNLDAFKELFGILRSFGARSRGWKARDSS